MVLKTTTNPGYHQSLQAFLPAGLNDLNAAGLPLRVETKFILPEHHLPMLLCQLSPHYCCLEIDELRSFNYTTNYFDTNDFQLYQDHHHGYGKRLKIRSRRYEDSGECYVEVKQKCTATKTLKTRWRTPSLKTELHGGDYAWVANPHLGNKALEWKLTNTFNRITLCDALLTERVTIDTNLVVANEQQSFPFQGLVVVEVKQAQLNHASIAMIILKAMRARVTRFSKYAIGASLLHPQLKNNNLKPIISSLYKHDYLA